MPFLDPYAYADGYSLPSDELSAMTSHFGGLFTTTAAATTTNANFEAMAQIGFTVRASYGPAYQRYTVFVSATQYSTLAGTDGNIGVAIDGVTTDIAHIRHDDANVEKAITGFVEVLPPAVPGFYLATLMWKRSSGTGVVTMSSGTAVTCVVREK